MFYLNSTLNFGILPVMVFQWEVYYMEDRLLSGLAAHITVAISSVYKLIFCQAENFYNNLLLLFLYKYFWPDNTTTTFFISFSNRK